MNKKRLSLIALAVLTVVIMSVVLAACNYYKWDSIGAGDPNAASESNGGFYVRQGKYVYFINGYVGDITSNEWGSALKQGIVRAECNADGTVNNGTVKVVVPTVINGKGANGGFAIYGNWIYYAAYNTEADKNGAPSTVKMDFFRTTLDASVTQRIGTIEKRDAEYIFMPTRILYVVDSEIRYFDFSGIKSSKPMKDGKGVTSGTLASNVEQVLWQYDKSYAKNQGAEVSDYIFYTEKLTGDNSFESYNNTYAVKYDGSNKKQLITKDTFLTDTEKQDIKDNPSNIDKYLNKVATVQLMSVYKESNDVMTVYYTKKHKNGAESFDTACLYMAKFDQTTGILDLTSEVKLTALTVKAIYALGYEKGCLAQTTGDYAYYYPALEDKAAAPIILKSAKIIHRIDGDKIIYSDSGTASVIDTLTFNQTGVTESASIVIAESIKIDWMNLEFDGNLMYFVNTKYNYVQFIDLSTFDPTADKAASTLIGKMTKADADKKAEDDKAAEEAEKK